MDRATLHAAATSIPPRSLAQVRNALASARKKGAEKAMASLMLKHGRLTDEARALAESVASK